jgi:amino acid adenylation domain-containing protein
MLDKERLQKLTLTAQKSQKEKTYWLEKFSGDFQKSFFPYDSERKKSATQQTDNVAFIIEGELYSRLMTISNQSDNTLFVLLLSNLTALLHRYSSNDDITIGVPIIRPEIEGEFLNMVLAIRSRVTSHMTFKQLLIATRQEFIESNENQNFPIETLVYHLQKDFSPTDDFPLFDIALLLDDIHDKKCLQNLSYNMTISFKKDDQYLRGNVEFNSLLYHPETIDRIIVNFTRLLEDAVFNIDKPVAQLQLLSPEETRHFLYQLNDTAAPYPVDKGFHQLFQQQAIKTPHKTAIIYDNNTITYKELNQNANQIAHRLINEGVVPDSIVALMLPATPELLVAILGILKAGGAYLPIDPSLPAQRIDFMIRDSACKLVLTSEQFPVADLENKIYILPVDHPSISSESSDDPEVPFNAQQLAYIIYTSGTTGIPKGILVPHQGLVNYCSFAAKEYGQGESRNFPLHTSISFDLTITSLFPPLITGGAVILYGGDEKDLLIPMILQDDRAEVVKLTPSHLKVIRGDHNFELLGIKAFVVGGEQLESSLAKEITANFKGNIAIYNEYGPTETVVGCTLHRYDVDKDNDFAVPIGIPIANTSVYILDKNKNPLPYNVPGQLYVGGDGVARGYLNRVAMTAAKFLDNPFKKGSRMYSTGDNAKWLPDGTLQFLGRIDNQVKIRGFRIELEEIRLQLEYHPHVQQAVISVHLKKSGDPILCGYVVSEEILNIAELKEYLVAKLPEYMVPTIIMQLQQMPLTPHGKVDMKALPEPQMTLAEDYTAPQSEMQIRLAATWSDILEVNQESIGKYSDFFQLGGHSLNATVLISRIHKIFDVRLSLTEIFENSNLENMADLLQQSIKVLHVSLEKVEEKEYYELSSAQKRLYILQKKDPEILSYNMPSFLLIEEAIDLQKLESVFNELIQRHESLRTSFHLTHGLPVQRIHDTVSFAFEYKHIDTSLGDSKELETQMVQDFIRPFDLSKPPLMRIGLLEIATDRHIFMFDMHHIITDGTSQEIFVREFWQLYEGNQLAPLKLQYKDYSQWMNNPAKQQEILQQEDFWIDQFQGDIPLLNLPLDFERPAVKRFEGGRVGFIVDQADTDRLKKLALNEDATLYMTMLAMFFTFLSRMSNQEDIIIGTATLGRTHVDLEGILGMFVNSLALRNMPAGEKPFSRFLEEVKKRSLDAFDNQDYLFENLVEKVVQSTDSSRNPLFDVMFALINIDTRIGDDSVTIDHPTSRSYSYEGTMAKFDLTMNITAGDQMSISIEYNTSLFKKETAQRFTRYFKTILTSITADPNIRLGDIPVVSEEEKQQLLFSFNDTKREIPRDMCYHQLFQQQVALTPDRIVVSHNEIQLSYFQLNRVANQIAHLLIDRGCSRNQLVGIFCKRSIDLLAAVLGVFKAGGAYIPFDINAPMLRNGKILEDSGVEILITTADSVGHFEAHLFDICAASNVKHLVYLDDVNNLTHQRNFYRTLKLSAFLSRGLIPHLSRDTHFSYRGQTLSHQDYIEKVNCLCHIIQKNQLQSSGKVAILFSNPLLKIIALLALNQFKIAFLEIDPSLRRNEKFRLIADQGITNIFSESTFLDELDQFFWQSETMTHYFILDDYNPQKSQTEHYFKDIWNYVAEESTNAINDYGWNSSYTDEPFSIEEMTEYIENFKTKLIPHLHAQSRVFEVGCGHGLVLFNLAPMAGYYYATDLSAIIIEKNRQRVKAENLTNVTLKAASAVAIDSVEQKDFDIVVCSSVTHYFPNTLYFEHMIANAIDLLKDQGIIYIDDMLDLNKKQDFIQSTKQYKEAHPNAYIKSEWDQDLFIGDEFFHHLQAKFPAIVSWQRSSKLGTIENELIKYRFDVMIKIDKQAPLNITPSKLSKTRYLYPDFMACSPQDFVSPTTHDPGNEISILADVCDAEHLAAYPNNNPIIESMPRDLSYVIYTSGSTGNPKGVMVHHLGMINHLLAKISDLEINQNDIIAQTASPCFDISVWQFLSTLMRGGKVVIVDDNTVLEPKALLSVLQNSDVTILELVPSLIHALLDSLSQMSEKSLQRLRWMMSTGEVLSEPLAREWFSHYPEIPLVNAYGPTEAADDITHHFLSVDFDIPGTTIPVGKSVQNMAVYILNKDLKLCPIGVRGEICVSGIGVGHGYWKDETKTKRSFIPNPYAQLLGIDDHAVLYKTGDVGYVDKDGVFHFLGRQDFQVKIRGHRIELSEIERELLNCYYIKEAAVIAKESQKTEKSLCAYIVTREEQLPDNWKIANLREFLAGKLPEYMVPNHFYQLEKMPLTINRKIDRKSLQAMELKSKNNLIAPRNIIEEKLVSIWSEVLEIDEGGIDIKANFFELNGNSLRSIMLVSKIYKEFNVSIPLTDIFNLPTIADLSEYIRNTAETAYYSIDPVEKREYYPLSSAQKRLYILQQLDQESTIYNVYMIEILPFKIDKKYLQLVLSKLLQRHESLRTSFIMVANEPVQKIHQAKEFDIDVEYFKIADGIAAGELESAERKNIDNFVRPFDLAQAPLLRAGLIESHDTRSILMIDMHHIITDATSRGIFVREFLDLYQGEKLPPLKLQYKDFSSWHNSLKDSDVFKQQEEYWQEKLGGYSEPLDLPTDKPRPSVQNFDGDTLHFRLGFKEMKTVHQMVLDQKVTLFMLMLSIYNIFLAKVSGQDDFSVGTVIAGRRHPDLEKIMGMFVNTLVLNIPIGNSLSFTQYLSLLRENVLEAFENQDFQFEDLVDKLVTHKDVSRNPLFDVGFVVYNVHVKSRDDVETKSQTLTPKPFDYKTDTSKFDLTLFCIEEDDYLSFSFEYSTRLFKVETIHRFVNYFKNIVSTVVVNPEIPLSEIEIIKIEEKKTLLYHFNETDVSHSSDKTVQQLFTDQVQRSPSATAIVLNREHITFSALDNEAGKMAQLLRNEGAVIGSLIGIKLQPCCDLIVSILAVLKAGAAYLPVDPSYPSDRVQFMLQDSSVNLLVSLKPVDELDLKIISPQQRHTFSIDAQVAVPVGGSDLAYVIYTSGTTGRPKGVAVEHSGVVNTLSCRSTSYKMTKETISLQLFSYAFDGFVTSFFTPIVSGGRVLLLDDQGIKDIDHIIRVLIREHVTHLLSVPALFTNILENLPKNNGHSLTSVTLAGDRISPQLIKQTREKSRTIVLMNEYGVTEASVMSTIHTYRQYDNSFNIGKPVWNTQLYVLNSWLKAQPIGILGELYISGAGLARGYINRPETSSERFINNPFIDGQLMYRTGDVVKWMPDGTLEFFGRADRQVKVRGFRVELEEIEARLVSHPSVNDVVVLVRETSTGGDTWAYIAANSQQKLDTVSLKTHLATDLPHYMIPGHFVQVEKIPLTPNGKVDTKALEMIGQKLAVGEKYIAPESELEKIIARIWQEVLDNDKIGTNDNFFDLGGNSLNIVQVNSRLKTSLDRNIPIVDMFQYPTIATLAAHFSKPQSDAAISTQDENQLKEVKDSIQETMQIFEGF